MAESSQREPHAYDAIFDLWALYGSGPRSSVVGRAAREGDREMGRRARKGKARRKKKANHGKRPVSR
ncbi:50S ribosomal protein bL37 [Sphaerisporangium sp. NBC_01403]|uniref:50S ribosomal protein bL37 n=1 Tax=Sphaerisporangium sp. NBC_01403 TaxID=2903599 RepID=UPI0038646279